ncbi:MAG: ABC transporter substrate-binding protein [Azospirillum sp.]|nr:ABC transporter substrate-binding protein [Azospirillum sp.]MCA3264772.1 ABC transporter substrate-binding protein [Azospirillum sp.]MCZ8124334.1 ABC transporter substrate-binding protein [Magnetospirillum sp.]
MTKPASHAALFAAAAVAALAAFAPPSASAQTLRYGSANDILGLDPHANNHGVTNAMKSNMYDPLVRRNFDGALQPGLAERWEQTSPTTWRFHLRRNVRFHGGQPFVADDVIASFERVRQPTSDMSYTVVSIERIEKVDDHTVTIVTKGPNPVLLQDLTLFFIVNKAWIDANNAMTVARSGQAGAATNFANNNVNGTGPFRLVERVADERTVMEINPNAWDSAAATGIQRAIWRPVSNAATRVAAIRSRELDIMYPVPLQDVAALQNAQGLTVRQGPTARTVYLAMDTARETLLDQPGVKNPLTDARVRRAIYQAIDIAAIQRVVMRGFGQTSGLIIAPQVQGWDREANQRLPHDPDAARRLLAEAGYPNGFTISMHCPNNRYINDEAICTAVVPMLARVGVNVRLTGMNFSQFIPAGGQGQFQFYLLGWAPGNFDLSNPLRELLTMTNGAGTFNWGRYSNPRVEALRDQIATETNMENRAALSRQVWQIVREDVPIVPLHQEPQVFAILDTVAEFNMRVQEDVELRHVRLRR